MEHEETVESDLELLIKCLSREYLIKISMDIAYVSFRKVMLDYVNNLSSNTKDKKDGNKRNH